MTETAGQACLSSLSHLSSVNLIIPVRLLRRLGFLALRAIIWGRRAESAPYMGLCQHPNTPPAVALPSPLSTLHSPLFICSVASGPPASDVLRCPKTNASTDAPQPATSPPLNFAMTTASMSIARMHMNMSTLGRLTKPTTGRLPL